MTNAEKAAKRDRIAVELLRRGERGLPVPGQTVVLELHLSDDEWLAILKDALATTDVAMTHPYTVKVWLLEKVRAAVNLAVYRATLPETDE